MARVFATHLWKQDTEKKIRTADMADKVYIMLVDYIEPQELPANSEEVTKWIRPVAPEYASRRGRISQK